MALGVYASRFTIRSAKPGAALSNSLTDAISQGDGATLSGVNSACPVMDNGILMYCFQFLLGPIGCPVACRL